MHSKKKPDFMLSFLVVYIYFCCQIHDLSVRFINVQAIRDTWQVKGFLRWCKSKLEDVQYGKKTIDLQPPR